MKANQSVRLSFNQSRTFSLSFCSSCKVIWILGGFCLCKLESWVLESSIQLNESRIPQTIGIRNPNSVDKESEIHSVKTVLNYLTNGEVFMHAMRPTKANLIFKSFYFTCNQ